MNNNGSRTGPIKSFSFICMQIPIQLNSYLFLNGPTGRIMATRRQMKRRWGLRYGPSANSSCAQSSGILPCNFLCCQWINMKVVVIRVPRKQRMKRLLKKYTTDDEISGSERFHTANSGKLHSVSAFLRLVSISLSTLTGYSANNDLLLLWCQFSNCNTEHDGLIAMTTNFRDSVIPRGRNKESGKEKIKPTPEMVNPSQLWLPGSQMECSSHAIYQLLIFTSSATTFMWVSTNSTWGKGAMGTVEHKRICSTAV